jgi:hypothetical protein
MKERLQQTLQPFFHSTDKTEPGLLAPEFFSLHPGAALDFADRSCFGKKSPRLGLTWLPRRPRLVALPLDTNGISVDLPDHCLAYYLDFAATC